jgi:hypothetical protein
MTDPWGEPDRPIASARCPWCSAEVKGDPVNCPSCGAALREEASADIPGVTQLDPAPTASARPAPRSRGFLGWLSGEYEPAEGAGERTSVSPPSDAVRAEMARLEMEAIQAEIDAAAAEAAAEREATAVAAASAEAESPEGSAEEPAEEPPTGTGTPA